VGFLDSLRQLLQPRTRASDIHKDDVGSSSASAAAVAGRVMPVVHEHDYSGGHGGAGGDTG
jgi:hypothetical protein